MPANSTLSAKSGRLLHLVGFALCRLGFLLDRRRRFLDGVFQQTPEGPPTILPANLLAFLVCPSPITDSYFVHTQPPFCCFDRDLRLETEPILLQFYRLNHLSAKRLVAGFHIAQVNIRKAIGNQGQDPVSYRVPKIEDAMRPAP